MWTDGVKISDIEKFNEKVKMSDIEKRAVLLKIELSENSIVFENSSEKVNAADCEKWDDLVNFCVYMFDMVKSDDSEKSDDFVNMFDFVNFLV